MRTFEGGVLAGHYGTFACSACETLCVLCVYVYIMYACVNVSWDCADKLVYTVVPLSISVCVVLTSDIVVLT